MWVISTEVAPIASFSVSPINDQLVCISLVHKDVRVKRKLNVAGTENKDPLKEAWQYIPVFLPGE